MFMNLLCLQTHVSLLFIQIGCINIIYLELFHFCIDVVFFM